MPALGFSSIQKKRANVHSSSRRNKQTSGLSAGIDISPSAYSGTDPVKALTVLLKLLTSLPSRIGGWQYKLTPPEHRLVLHLISIVDPFVYHGVRTLVSNPFRSEPDQIAFTGLIDQPTEILDAILSHVDSPKDLLNIGLVCRRLHDVIFPRQFDYRVIRCKVSSVSVWNHFIMHRSLARNVRKLEIIDERQNGRLLIPRGIIQRDTDLESTDDELRMHSKQERYLAAALGRMTALKEFKWSCNHSPISIAHIWPRLMTRATGLQSMEIYDNLVFAPNLIGRCADSESGSDSDTEGILTPSNGSLSGIPSASLDINNVVFRSTSHSYGAAKQPELNLVSMILQKCTKLKNLEITYIPPRLPGNLPAAQSSVSRVCPLADDFFSYSRWSSALTVLILTNLRCSTPIPPATFLSAHPALKMLHLDVNILNGGFSNGRFLVHGSLPLLREVKASKDVINAILECRCDYPRPLESIKLFKLSGHIPGNGFGTPQSPRSVPDPVFLTNLRNVASTVNRIELAGWHDMEDVRRIVAAVPNVQHLDIGKKLGSFAPRSTNASERGVGGGNNGCTSPVANIIEWIELISTLPELSTLHGVKFFYGVSSAPIGPFYGPRNDNGDATRHARGTSTSSSASLLGNTPKHPSTSHPGPLSVMERSRMRKNDETAGLLAWKCTKLRWVDHWEEGSGKVIYLVGDHHGLHTEDKVRWEVRRVEA